MSESSSAHVSHSSQRKIFARIRGKSLTRIYCVDDPNDWSLIKDLGGGRLICHRSGCNAQYKKPMQSQKGTRFLAAMKGQGCGHGLARSDLGGGPMSPDHQWLQGRLYKIVCDLVPQVFSGSKELPSIEHGQTHADLYVPQAKLSIEVQRWPTDFKKRTEARQQDGGSVIWFITEDFKDRAWNSGVMSTVPAITVAIEDPNDRGRKLRPWESEQENRVARLRLYGTVAQLRDGVLKTREIQPHLFLREVLAGERIWYPPATPGVIKRNGEVWRSGFWARPEELQASQDARRADRQQRTPAPTRDLGPLQTAENALVPPKMQTVDTLRPLLTSEDQVPVPDSPEPNGSVEKPKDIQITLDDAELRDGSELAKPSAADAETLAKPTIWQRILQWAFHG